MAPLQGEQVILEAEKKTLTITTHRVRHLGRAGRIATVMLEAITSCEIAYVAHRVLLLLAALVLGAGFALNTPRNETPLILGIGAAVVFVIAYFGTRKQVVRVSSPSCHIDVALVEMNIENATQLMDTIEWAKNERYLLRQGQHNAAPVGARTAAIPRVS